MGVHTAVTRTPTKSFTADIFSFSCVPVVIDRVSGIEIPRTIETEAATETAQAIAMVAQGVAVAGIGHGENLGVTPRESLITMELGAGAGAGAEVLGCEEARPC